MTLTGAGDSRQNHFNLIRLLAASAVLFSHGATMVGVRALVEPEGYGYFLTWGTIAVNVFFVVSGYLVTASLYRRNDLTAFFWARALRIFPGLWVMLALTVFCFAPLVCEKPVLDFFLSGQTWDYLLHCATVIGGMGFYLPGVFEHGHADKMFNRSLWTLPLELRMYLLLGTGWLACMPLKAWSNKAFLALASITGAASLGFALSSHFVDGELDLSGINVYMFAAGACLYAFRGAVPRSGLLLGGLVAALAASVAHADVFFCAYLVLLPLLVLQLAYAPCAPLLRFNEAGDYSYGVYIYSYPAQQAVLALAPGLGLVGLTAASLPLTLVLAMLSWRFVEKPALAMKDRLSAIRAPASAVA